jgi:hypothetical protein
MGSCIDRVGGVVCGRGCGHRGRTFVADLDRPFRHRRLEPDSLEGAVSARGEFTTAEQQTGLQQSLTRMRAQTPVAPATSSQYPAVSSQARLQPDLYAAAFTRELLTQDYRASRDDVLAWVQSESAQSTEPLVVGLTPVELRPRLALWSVQDDTGSPAIVPSRSAWAALAERRAYTTVQIQKVTEPVAWADAVAGGQITDPGVTARQVDAEVTLHTTDRGHPITAASSVALTIQLEGPPGQGRVRFVVAVIYDAWGSPKATAASRRGRAFSGSPTVSRAPRFACAIGTARGSPEAMAASNKGRAFSAPPRQPVDRRGSPARSAPTWGSPEAAAASNKGRAFLGSPTPTSRAPRFVCASGTASGSPEATAASNNGRAFSTPPNQAVQRQGWSCQPGRQGQPHAATAASRPRHCQRCTPRGRRC